MIVTTDLRAAAVKAVAAVTARARPSSVLVVTRFRQAALEEVVRLVGDAALERVAPTAVTLVDGTRLVFASRDIVERSRGGRWDEVVIHAPVSDVAWREACAIARLRRLTSS